MTITTAALRNHVNEILIPHQLFTNSLKRMEQLYDAMECSSEPLSIALIGESRSGKSRILEHFAHLHPPYRTPEGRCVPILRATMPSKPQISTLTEVLLHALGDPRFSKGRESDKTERLYTLLKKARTRIIALDEFQHFKEKATLSVQEYAADWLKVLVDNCKIGFLVAGLESSLSVIYGNEQLAGRFMSPIRFGRFIWIDDNDRKIFITILKCIQEAMLPFEIPALGTDEMAIRCYSACGGLIGYLMKILRQASWNAISDGTFSIRLTDLAKAFEEAVPVEQFGKSANPFGPDFFQVPEDIRLAQAYSIGTRRADPEVRPKKPRTKSPAKLDTPPAKILNAKGGQSEIFLV